jgi:hypothetical protein
MRLLIFLCISMLVCINCNQAEANDITIHGLPLIYSRDRAMCNEAAKQLRDDKFCRRADAKMSCSDKDILSLISYGSPVKVFDEIATNEYGYTQVSKSLSASLDSAVIIYLNNFLGDNSPRILETWKVNSEELQQVLSLPPGPVPYEEWIRLNPRHPYDINSQEFAALLANGEKISDEWSPIIVVLGNSYAVKRECSGLWEYG